MLKKQKPLKYHYYEFDNLQRIFTSILRREGIEGLKNYIQKPIGIKREIIASEIKKLEREDFTLPSWWKEFVKCLEDALFLKNSDDSVRDAKQARIMIREKDSTISLAFERLLSSFETLEWRLEQGLLNDIEEHSNELKRIKRKVVDVKTKWGGYGYPKNVKTKKNDSQLIEFLKFLGFRCEVLEVTFPQSGIQIASSKL